MTTVANKTKYCNTGITFYENLADFGTILSTDILLSMTPTWETVDGTDDIPVLSITSTNGDAGSAFTVLRNIHNPELANDAATKAYVDGLAVSGVTWKNTAKIASTVDIATFPPTTLLTIDGVTVLEGDRVLIKDQIDQDENGIWIVAAAASPWTRAPDMSEGVSASGFAVWVDQGTTNADTGYVVTSNIGSDIVGNEVVDSGSAIVWAKFTSTPGVAGTTGDIQFAAAGGGHDSATSGVLNWDNTNFALTVSGDATAENALIIGLGDLSLTEGDIFLSNAGILNMGAANELTINHTGAAGAGLISNDVGTLTIEQADTGQGDLIIKNAGDTGGDDIVLELGEGTGIVSTRFTSTAGTILDIASDGDIVQSLGGITLNATATSGITLFDAIPLNLGEGSDLVLVHSGAAGSITNNVGIMTVAQAASGSDLIIENTGVTEGDDVIFRVAGSTGGTGFTFVGDSGGTADTVMQIIAVQEASTSATTGTVRIKGGLGVTGDITATCVNTLSDATTKTNITPLSMSDPLSKIKQIEGFNYNFLPGYGQNGRLNTGVLAQQIETIEGMEHCINTCETTGYKSVNYTFMTPMMIEGIKQQQKQIESQEKQIEELRNIIMSMMKNK